MVTDVAATASGGETIAPIKNAKGQSRFGMSQWAAMATMDVVKITSPIAAKPMGLKLALKSCQLVFHAAAYNNGGKKIMNTTSGPNSITGSPGMMLIQTPLSTKAIGKGNLYLLLSIPRNATPNNRNTITAIFSITVKIIENK